MDESNKSFRFPLYYLVKFAFLVWLQLPSANGAKDLYISHLHQFLLKHQAVLDQIVDFIYSQLSKFVSAHQAKNPVCKDNFFGDFDISIPICQGHDAPNAKATKSKCSD